MDAETQNIARLTLETLAHKPRNPLLVASSVASAAVTALSPIEVPLYAVGKDGDGYTLVECRGRAGVPLPPREPADKASEEYRAWCKTDRQAAALLRAYRARLALILSSVSDLEWLQSKHPEVARTLPPMTAQKFGRALEAFGADQCTARTHTEIWAYVRSWPGRVREVSAPEAPWQDASGWEE